MSALAVDLLRWILTVPAVDAGSFAACLGERLVAEGVPVARMVMYLRAMHPEISVQSVVWTPEQGSDVKSYPHRLEQTAYFLASPSAALLAGAPWQRRRLQGPDARLDYPICEELAAQGYTDYAIWPLRFTD